MLSHAAVAHAAYDVRLPEEPSHSLRFYSGGPFHADSFLFEYRIIALGTVAKVRCRFQSFLTPVTVFRLNLLTGTLSAVKEQEVRGGMPTLLLYY
jgi:hypothetical protein